MTPHFFKRSLLLFWSVWLSIVVATNLGDGLKELGILGASWQFASGNYAFVADTTSRYGMPAFNGVLFLGVILWESTAGLLFWLAWWDTRQQPAGRSRFLYPAFFASLMLWAAFMLADEVFIAYPVEATHLRLFVAQLLTLLAIVLLPDGDNTSPEAPTAPTPRRRPGEETIIDPNRPGKSPS